jgi:hypothetical protein
VAVVVTVAVQELRQQMAQVVLVLVVLTEKLAESTVQTKVAMAVMLKS